MVLFFTATLLFSCIGIASLIGVKRWELATGHMVGSNVRPQINRISGGISVWVTHSIPTLIRVYAKRLVETILGLTHRLAALVVLYVERLLEKTLHLVRNKTDVRRGVGEASAFLREVSEHKQKLLHARGQEVGANKSSLHKR